MLIEAFFYFLRGVFPVETAVDSSIIHPPPSPPQKKINSLFFSSNGDMHKRVK